MRQVQVVRRRAVRLAGDEPEPLTDDLRSPRRVTDTAVGTTLARIDEALQDSH